jgi:glucose-1-phosphate cytidylyltransferase
MPGAAQTGKIVKVVILAGGYGTRLLEETVVKPKPMVEIGERPILWHIMNGYAARGFKEFVIALGYKGELIKTYFLSQYHMQGSLTVNLANGNIDLYEATKNDWLVHLMDTGLNSSTGGRLYHLRDFLKDATFMFTYGDGVSNVDINDLLRHHKSHGKHATITAVRPPARFGVLNFDGDCDRVTTFGEKTQASEGWINGGFFVLEPAVLDYLPNDEEPFEREPLQTLAAEGQLMAYRHEGFWQCMDTLRDVKYLEELWSSGSAPWKVWDG